MSEKKMTVRRCGIVVRIIDFLLPSESEGFWLMTNG